MSHTLSESCSRPCPAGARTTPWRAFCSMLLAGVLALGLAACGGGSTGTGGGAGAGGGGTGTSGGTDTTPAVSSGSVTALITALVGTETYSLVYAGTLIGIDARNATATFNANMAMNAYAAIPNGTTTISETLGVGSNLIAEKAGNADANIGRWNGGQFSGDYYGSTDVANLMQGGQQGFHVGLAYKPNPATLPTNCSMSYSLSAATMPTRGDGGVAPGTVSSATVVATFGGASDTPTFAISLAFSGPGSAFTYTPPSTADYFDVGNNDYRFSTNGASTAESVNIAFGGTLRTSMVFAYHSYPIPGSGGSANSISAVGLLTRTASTCP